MPSVWVTGAKGFLGRHLVRRLANDAGTKVSALGHGAMDSADADWLGIQQWINGDVTSANLDSLARVTGPPNAIFHLAGGSSVGVSLQTPEEDFKRTVASTAQLLEWVRRRSEHVHVVFASSAAVYGSAYERPIKETDQTIPISPYGYHKRMAEMLLESYSRNFGIRTSIVRLFSIYGPGLRKQLLWDICSRLATGTRRLTLSGSGYERRDWVHVTDAVHYLILAERHASDRTLIVNGGTEESASIRDVAEAICSAWGATIDICFNGRTRAGDPAYLVACMKEGRSIGLKPTIAWSVGLREYVNWFRQGQ